jgi:rubrerythrin
MATKYDVFRGRFMAALDKDAAKEAKEAKRAEAKLLYCKHCRHKWPQRTDKPPKTCPKCGALRWDAITIF